MSRTVFTAGAIAILMVISIVGLRPKQPATPEQAKAQAAAALVAKYYPAPVNQESVRTKVQRIQANANGTFSPVIEIPAAKVADSLPTERRKAMQARANREAKKLAERGVKPLFPANYNKPVRVESIGYCASASAIEVNNASVGTVVDGNLVYPNVYDGCDVAYRCTAMKTEEFFVVHDAGNGTRKFQWQIAADALKPRLHALGVIEFLDTKGVSRMRINVPEGKDADGNKLCLGERLKYDLSEVKDGVATLTLSADLGGLKMPVVIDPSWSATNDLNFARAGHTQTLLPDGTVLITGGQIAASSLNSAEIFTPDGNGGGSFTNVAAPMLKARYNHTATLLTNDTVLLVGGLNRPVSGSPLPTIVETVCEIYTPSTGSFTAGGTLNVGRQGHTATLLSSASANGFGKVLITGGVNINGIALDTAELFDAGNWTLTGNLRAARYQHTATLLSNNEVLVAGGNSGAGEIDLVDIFKPGPTNAVDVPQNHNIFAAGLPMIVKRRLHQAILVEPGTEHEHVLVVGGFNPGLFPSCELYHTDVPGWDPTGSMSRPRTEHRLALLGDDKVLAVGCHDSSFASVEIYDADSFDWEETGSLTQPHTEHAMTVLPNGSVLLSGGFAGDYIDTAEIYDPRPEPIIPDDPYTANGPTPLSITLAAESIGDNRVFTITTPPQKGSLSGLGANQVYTAQSGAIGSDSFGFTITDSFGTSAEGTISIEIFSIAPTLTGSTPDAAIAGSTGFTISVSGTDFIDGAVVRWDGVDRATTYVSTTLVTAVIPDTDIAAESQVSVTVFNPAPGGGLSNAITVDVVDFPLGIWTVDNVDDSGKGSLRWAMKNARNGDLIIFDSVVFDLDNASAATVINTLSELPAMDKGSVTIDASNRRVTVNGSGAGSSCGIVISSDANVVKGLGLVGFTKSGVRISSGNNNILGGSRSLPAVGTGPNGEGLRIGSCGAFGIELSNTSCDNTVKGCWIGLDNSGMSPEANLAGIIIQSGSCRNIIGSDVADEANVISGNRFEGITVTGTGTDDNVVTGNNIGAAALDNVVARSLLVASRDDAIFGRGQMGNGNAGVFLSKGTNNTSVGGDDDSSGNAIGFNGGSGVEVRASTSKRNNSRRNRISRNSRGGISLFDGSNNGISPPVLGLITPVIPTSSSREDVFPSRVNLKGSTSGDGEVEIFTDPGEQGASFVGRASVIGGAFDLDVDVLDTENITATFTDTDGNTSPFALFGKAPKLTKPDFTSALTALGTVNTAFSYTITASGSQPMTFTTSTLPEGLTLSGDTISGTVTTTGTFTVTLTATNAAGSTTKTLVIIIGMPGFSTVDTDGDGVSDVLELLAGTNSNSAAAVPELQDSLSVDKVQVKLGFSKPGKDSLMVVSRLTLPTTFVPSGSIAGVQFGPVAKSNLTLDSKGKSPKGTSVIAVKLAAKGSSSIAVTLSIKGEDLASLLATSGFTNANVTGENLVVPVAVAITTNGRTSVYNSQVAVLYKAKQGKSGSAKR
jgi:hypothetical protein